MINLVQAGVIINSKKTGTWHMYWRPGRRLQEVHESRFIIRCCRILWITSTTRMWWGELQARPPSTLYEVDLKGQVNSRPWVTLAQRHRSDSWTMGWEPALGWQYPLGLNPRPNRTPPGRKIVPYLRRERNHHIQGDVHYVRPSMALRDLAQTERQRALPLSIHRPPQVP